ncbi:MAG TPA: hypothetical protein VF771_02870 [Longimicrobiaceae bacterium]
MRRPAGYTGLAVCAALFATVLVAVVLSPNDSGDWVIGVMQCVLALISALAWVTAEALWRMRPWAYRASRALARSVVGVMALTGTLVLLDEPWDGFWILFIAAITAWGLRPVLEYVRGRALALHPAP